MKGYGYPRGVATVALVGHFLVGCTATRQARPGTAQSVSQQQQPDAGEVRESPARERGERISPPPLEKTGKLELPPLTRASLPNGLQLLIMPDRRLPLVNVSMVVKVGAIDDPADRVGLADFTVDMLRQGVRGMAADLISERIDAAGATLGAHSGYELSTVSCSGRSRALQLCLEMVAALVMRPTFPQDELKEVREQLLSRIRRSRDAPATLAAQHFYNQLFGDDHPAGRPMTAASIRAVTRGDVARSHRRHFVPGAALLVISGDVAPKQLMSRLSSLYGSWRRRAVPRREKRTVAQPAAGLRLILVDKPDLSQSFFALGHAGVERRHARRDAINVMNFVLGAGGFSSRLMQQVRSKGGKTYGISSEFVAHDDDGVFAVRSFTRNDQIVATLELVRRQLQQIGADPPRLAEIRGAKGKIAGGYAIRFVTASQLAGALASAQLRGLPDTFVTELPVRVEALTREQISEAARRFVHHDRLVGAIVGKASVVAPLLRAAKIAFSTVSYLDPISARERAQLPAGDAAR